VAKKPKEVDVWARKGRNDKPEEKAEEPVKGKAKYA
jgi:hypothetical protein